MEDSGWIILHWTWRFDDTLLIPFGSYDIMMLWNRLYSGHEAPVLE